MMERLTEIKAESARHRTLWEDALAKEVSLIKQLWDEREAWAQEKAALIGGKVTPIRTSEQERANESIAP